MLSLVLAAVGPFILLALYGFFRMQRLQDVLVPDWQILAEFGASLRAFTQSRGHDAKALAAMVALAPDVGPLVFGFRREAAPAAPGSPDTAPAPGRVALSPERLFTGLERLPQAFDDAAANPGAAAELDRLENLRGQILGAEWLLQSEMKRLAHDEANLNAWLYEGAAGLALLAGGHFGDAQVSARTRRRLLEADPRFQWATRAALWVALAIGLVLALAGMAATLRSIVSRRGG